MPVECLKDQSNPESAQCISIRILNDILRPHLTEHQAGFRCWLEKAKQKPEFKNLSPQKLQKKYPGYNTLMMSLKDANRMLIDSAEQLRNLMK